MEKQQKQVLATMKLPDDPKEMLGTPERLQQVLMMYSCAMREVKTKLEVLNDEFSLKGSRNPIETIKTRVKRPASIVEKLERNGFDVSLKSVLDNLNDVAGVRVTCSFIDDIYAVADMLISQEDVTLVEIRDYIKEPKENGYRSLHVVISVPVFFSNQKLDLRVELQIRTVAMDYWASLQNDLKVKGDIPDVEAIQKQLRHCADVIAETDKEMMMIRDQIEVLSSVADQLDAIKGGVGLKNKH